MLKGVAFKETTTRTGWSCRTASFYAVNEQQCLKAHLKCVMLSLTSLHSNLTKVTHQLIHKRATSFLGWSIKPVLALHLLQHPNSSIYITGQMRLFGNSDCLLFCWAQGLRCWPPLYGTHTLCNMTRKCTSISMHRSLYVSEPLQLSSRYAARPKTQTDSSVW